MKLCSTKYVKLCNNQFEWKENHTKSVQMRQQQTRLGVNRLILAKIGLNWEKWPKSGWNWEK